MTATTVNTPPVTATATANATNTTCSNIDGAREQILSQVDKILLLHQPPSRQGLHALLRLCDAQLTMSSMDAPVAREKAFRALKARLHPDKHATLAKARVTLLFQTVQTYYVESCHAMAAEQLGTTRRRSSTTTTDATSPHVRAASYTRASSSNSHSDPLAGRRYTRRSTFAEGDQRTTSSSSCSSSSDSSSDSNLLVPLEFDVFAKWSFLQQVPRDTPFHAVSTKGLHYHVAYACLNQRGAIVHGRAIDCSYQVPVDHDATTTDNNSSSSILQVWKEAGFDPEACTVLSTVEQIQYEILHHGPVVSTSFVLDRNYYHSLAAQRHAGNFNEHNVNQPHPLLIVGWTMSPTGPVWLVRALRGPTFFVGMGQFQIEACCVAPPLSLLRQKCWQSPGPYWDVSLLESKCPDWNHHFKNNSDHSSLGLLEILPLTSADVEALADLWNVGLNAVMVERRTFVLRDREQMAHSRRVMLRDVARVPYPPGNNDDSKRVWKVTVSVVRN